MTYLENNYRMVYNKIWIRISLIFLVLLLVTYFFNLKPKFFLPRKYFNHKKHILSKIVQCILAISILLLPLDLQFISDKKIITEKILPVQIIFDVSLSMAADDIVPSRYDSAKTALLKLIQKLDGYNISLITFSWIPFIYIPFSTDTNAIISKFQDTNLWDFPPTTEFLGTAIGDALLLGINNLNKLSTRWGGQASDNLPGVIILITDWDSNKWYDPLQVLSIIQKKKVPIFALGIWESDYLIGNDKWGSPVQTSINIPLLQEISKQTGWEFYRVLEESNFDEFFDYLKDVIKAQERQRIENQYFILNTYILYMMAACILFLLYIQVKQLQNRNISI